MNHYPHITAPNTFQKDIKVFLVYGIFNIPPDITTSKDILNTKAHYTLDTPFTIEEFCSTISPTKAQYLILSGDIKLYIQYVSKDLSSSIKQHYCVLPFCEYLPLSPSTHHHNSLIPQLCIEDIYFHLLDTNLIYYNLSISALA